MTIEDELKYARSQRDYYYNEYLELCTYITELEDKLEEQNELEYSSEEDEPVEDYEELDEDED